MAKRLGTIRQGAAHLGVTRKSVYSYLNTDPTFPRLIRLSPGAVRIDMDALDAWIESKTDAAKVSA